MASAKLRIIPSEWSPLSGVGKGKASTLPSAIKLLIVFLISSLCVTVNAMRRTFSLLPCLALAAVSVGCSAIAPNESATTEKDFTIAREIDARQAIRSLLFDQQTYYIENSSFTTTSQKVVKLDARVESPDYTYQVKPKVSKTKGVMITAAAKKPGLRSFTGVVFAVPTREGTLTISDVCETIEPSQKAPVITEIPQRPDEAIKCPPGSRSSLSIVAVR